MGRMLSESLIFPTALLYVPRGFPGGESGGRPDGAVVARIQLCCHTMSLEGIEAEAVSRIMVSRRLQSRLEIK